MSKPVFFPLPVLLLILFSCTQSHTQNQSILPEVAELMRENHIQPIALDNTTSEQLFEAFLKRMDPDKMLLTLQDVRQLTPYLHQLDEEILEGHADFQNAATLLFEACLNRVEAYVDEQLDKLADRGIAAEKPSVIQADSWSANEDDLGLKWNNQVITQYWSDYYLYERTLDSGHLQQIDSVALERTKLHYNRHFSAWRNSKLANLGNIFLNTYIGLNDYQSAFLSLEEKKQWDDAFTRQFVGVGVALEIEDVYPVIESVVVGGPAWQSKAIEPGHRLTHLSSEPGVWQHLAGMSLSEVIGLLKGEAGTGIEVKVLDQAGESRIVELKRAAIDMPKTRAFILRDQETKQMTGYISLPRFYVGERTSSEDLLAALNAFNAQAVDQLILDLRNNQGGSSREAIRISGFFLDGGPVMRVHYADGNERTYDDDIEVQFSGKLVVVVNESSSSASELFAANMQDRQRAVVVGQQTFGKGTMQRFFDVYGNTNEELHGSVKLSIAMFYTGLGRTTQFFGVTPDIVLSSGKPSGKTGERVVDHALVVAHLPDYDVKQPKSAHDALVTELSQRSDKRTSRHPGWICLAQQANGAISEKASTISTYEEYRSNRLSKQQQTCKTDTSPDLFIARMIATEQLSESQLIDIQQQLAKDPTIRECYRIMVDYSRM